MGGMPPTLGAILAFVVVVAIVAGFLVALASGEDDDQ